MPTETPYTPLQDLEEELAALDSRYAAEAIDEDQYEPKRQALTAQIYGIHLRNAKTDLARELDGMKVHGLIDWKHHAELLERTRTARTIEQVKEIATFKRPNQ